MFRRIADILGMIKFSHTLFALPFALLGAALAARGDSGWQFRPLDWLGMTPMASGIAIRGDVGWRPVFLAAAVFFWVSGFDIIYACQDFDVDRRLGLHSVPARLGVRGALRLAAACHAMMVVALVALGL